MDPLSFELRRARSVVCSVVSERLLGIPRSLALFGLLGLAAALVLYGRGLGITLPRYDLSKAAIVARATANFQRKKGCLGLERTARS